MSVFRLEACCTAAYSPCVFWIWAPHAGPLAGTEKHGTFAQMITLKPILFAIAAALSVTAAAQTVAPVPVAPAPAPVAQQVSEPIAPVATPAGVAPMESVASPVTTVGTSSPSPLVGQPIAKKVGLQPQVTKLGEQAEWMHNWILMPVMVVISLFVLGLMLLVSVRFRRKANPVASKTTHNTFIEVVWTLVPVLILVAIAVPSISLLAAQFKPAPKDAITLKAIGYQWYWGYEYPDQGISEFTSNMLTDAQADAKGEPRLLAVDNRVVLPVNTPIRLLTTGTDVIHAWAIPAFWIKMDAVPGRINETSFTVDKTGVYYGQCSELCGIKHGFMPIAVEVVSKEDFAAWVRAKGGKAPGDVDAAPAAAPVTVDVSTNAATPVAATK
jgi:cytochrome c oxidase subunit II